MIDYLHRQISGGCFVNDFSRSNELGQPPETPPATPHHQSYWQGNKGKRPFPFPRAGKNNLAYLGASIWKLAVWLRNGR